MIVYQNIPFTLTVIATEVGNPALTYAWTQVSGPTTCILSNIGTPTVSITAPIDGTYIFNCAVSDSQVTNNQTITVTVTPYFTATQSYTATCATGTTGSSVTRSATVSSLISQSDANTQALNAAVTAATTALRCDPMEGFVGCRLVIPNLNNQFSFFSPSSVPVTSDVAFFQGTELGIQFSSSVSGYVLGIRFYKGVLNIGTHTGSLWNSTGGLIATATFVNETASGWQQVYFASPVVITANTTYIASYHAPAGWYAGDAGGFSSSIISGPLTAPVSAGLYSNNPTSNFPNTLLNTVISSSNANYWVDVIFSTTNLQIQINIAQLVTGSPAAPASIKYVYSTIFNPDNIPINSIVDLSSLFSANTGMQTFYIWAVLTALVNGVTYVQCPSSAISLNYATPVGTVSGQTVRFRDVETLATNYQGYSSAYALTVSNTAIAAVQMTLDVSNNWDIFSLNTHGWDDLVYGAKPNRGYSTLILTELTGTASSPQKQTILNVNNPSYNINDPYDFANNRLSFTPYFNGAQQSATYVLRRTRIGADDSLVYDPNETGFRFETSSSFLFSDYTSPNLALTNGSITPLSPNSSAGIVAANNIAVNFSPFPGQQSVVAFPVPRFTIVSFRWKLPTDTYTHLAVYQISGTPASPTGITGQYFIPLGDPTVLDGPGNMFLPIQGFDTLQTPFTFTPFTAVFYSAFYNPVNQSYTVYPNSFPILNNPRTVNGHSTYTVNSFAGFQQGSISLPQSINGAVTFSGFFAYAESLYNARVNGGNQFSI